MSRQAPGHGKLWTRAEVRIAVGSPSIQPLGVVVARFWWCEGIVLVLRGFLTYASQTPVLLFVHGSIAMRGLDISKSHGGRPVAEAVAVELSSGGLDRRGLVSTAVTVRRSASASESVNHGSKVLLPRHPC